MGWNSVSRFGKPDDPALLFVNGFTSQLTAWETAMCERFAARGRFVIRYDNRDVGLSTHLAGGGPVVEGDGYFDSDWQ